MDDETLVTSQETLASVSSNDAGSPTGSSTGTVAGTGTASGTTAGTGTDSPLVFESETLVGEELNAYLLELLEQQSETDTLVLQSMERMETQLEACISVLLIFFLVGTLNYIYKFFKMFF